MHYAVSMSGQVADATSSRRDVFSSVCRNCGNEAKIPASAKIDGGDRILVAKLLRPNRWDLTVFWNPESPSVAYVKRLVGLPGETLEVAGGDVFIDGTRVQKRPGTARDMWLPLYDTEFVPERIIPDGPKWAPERDESGWEQSDGHWSFTARDDTRDALVFSEGLTDRMAYNTRGSMHTIRRPLPVGDIQLDCLLGAISGEGSFGFEWVFRHRRVTVTILSSGDVEIVTAPHEGLEGSQKETLKGRSDADLSGHAILTFAVRDGHAYLMQGTQLLALIRVLPMEIEQAKKQLNTRDETCRLAMFARACSLKLSRVILRRDVYYQTLDEMQMSMLDSKVGGDRITLGDDEYYLLGDNSARSKDSRFFGPVGADALIGTSRWIYWPPSRWHAFD